MKQLLFLLLAFPLVFSSCSSSDEDPIIENIDVKLKVGEAYNLPVGVYTIDAESDDFIATVAADGEIKGVRDGATKAILKSGNLIYDCKIAVAASTTLYLDLKYLVGASKDEVLKLYGEPALISNQTYFFNKQNIENENAFVFDKDNKVAIAATYFAHSYRVKLKNHLLDRYKQVASDGTQYMIVYGDGDDFENIQTAVVVETSDREIRVSYMSKKEFEKQLTERKFGF